MAHAHFIKLPPELADKQLLTVEEAASLIRVNPKTMYSYISQRKKGLFSFKIMGNVRIPTNKFLRWIDINAIG